MMNELQSQSKAKIVLESAAYALILLFLFAGNFLTLLIVVFNRRIQTITFVASLAISDFGLGAFSVCSLSLPVLVTSQWPFSNTTCQYQKYIVGALAVNSIHTLAFMAVNRYFRIVKPAKYRRYFAKKKTKFLILVSRLYAMCSALP